MIDNSDNPYLEVVAENTSDCQIDVDSPDIDHFEGY